MATDGPLPSFGDVRRGAAHMGRRWHLAPPQLGSRGGPYRGFTGRMRRPSAHVRLRYS